MHKKAKITYPKLKGIPGVLTAQGFHKGRLDCVEVSVLHCLDGIAINASSREVFHRRRLTLPSSPSTLSSTISTSSSSLHSSTSTLNSPSNNSSTKEEKKEKSRTQEKIDKTEEGKKNKTEEETKTQNNRTKKIEILLRDAFGTFKGEVPYYSARLLSIPEVVAPPHPELETAYENMCEERRKEEHGEEWLIEGEEK